MVPPAWFSRPESSGRSSRSDQGLFLYLVLDRSKANLALARHSLTRVEGDISI